MNKKDINELLHVFTHSFTKQLGEIHKDTQDTVPIFMDVFYNQGLRVWEW